MGRCLNGCFLLFWWFCLSGIRCSQFCCCLYDQWFHGVLGFVGVSEVCSTTIVVMTTLTLASYGGGGFRVGNGVARTRSSVLCLRGLDLGNPIGVSSIGLNRSNSFTFRRGTVSDVAPRFCHLHVTGRDVGLDVSSARAIGIGTTCPRVDCGCRIRNSRGYDGVGRLSLGRVALRDGVGNVVGDPGVKMSSVSIVITHVLTTCGRSMGAGCVFGRPVGTSSCCTLFRAVRLNGAGSLVFGPHGGGSSIGIFTTMTAD